MEIYFYRKSTMYSYFYINWLNYFFNINFTSILIGAHEINLLQINF